MKWSVVVPQVSDQLLLLAAHCGASIAASGPLMLALLAAGFVGSAAHCAGMCGPFVLAQVGIRQDAGRRTPALGLRRAGGLLLLPYHLGRATTYVLLGAVLAAPVGIGVDRADLRWLPTAMLFMAAGLFLWQALRGWRILPAPALGAPGGLLQLAGPLFAHPAGWRGYALGVVLGFLPCGLLYSALGAAAATAQPLSAAIAMLGFVLGTMPMLLGIGLLGQGAAGRWRALAQRALPFVAAVNALVLVAMGLRFGGVV
jgi:sulfite exporter TauE/SafE